EPRLRVLPEGCAGRSDKLALPNLGRQLGAKLLRVLEGAVHRLEPQPPVRVPELDFVLPGGAAVHAGGLRLNPPWSPTRLLLHQDFPPGAGAGPLARCPPVCVVTRSIDRRSRAARAE